MKRLWRLMALVLTLSIILTSFAGCGGKNNETADNNTQESGSNSSDQQNSGDSNADNLYPENGLPKDQEVTLKVGLLEAGYGRKYYDYAVETFTKKFPNVKIETTASPKIDTLVDTKAQAGNDEDMFDIFYGGSDDLIKTGKFEPLNDLLEMTCYDTPDKKIKDVLVPGLEIKTYDDKGTIYGSPLTMYVGGMFYDKKWFAENGWNQNPKTWDEFVQLCEDIKAKGVMPITYAGVYDYITYIFSWHKAMEAAEINGTLDEQIDIYRNYKQPVFDNQGMRDMYTKFYELGKKGYFMKGVSAINHTQSQMQVIQHKAAMCPSGDWIENEMKNDEKDPAPNDFEWGFMTIPLVNSPDQHIWVVNGISFSFGMWAAKPELNKKWSKEFLRWLYNEDCQKAIVDMASALPVRDGIDTQNASSALKSILDYSKNNNVRFEQCQRKVTLNLGPSFSQASKLLSESNCLIAEGKRDPLPILKKCEELFTKALEEGEKASN